METTIDNTHARWLTPGSSPQLQPGLDEELESVVTQELQSKLLAASKDPDAGFDNAYRNDHEPETSPAAYPAESTPSTNDTATSVSGPRRLRRVKASSCLRAVHGEGNGCLPTVATEFAGPEGNLIHSVSSLHNGSGGSSSSIGSGGIVGKGQQGSGAARGLGIIIGRRDSSQSLTSAWSGSESSGPSVPCTPLHRKDKNENLRFKYHGAAKSGMKYWLLDTSKPGSGEPGGRIPSIDYIPSIASEESLQMIYENSVTQVCGKEKTSNKGGASEQRGRVMGGRVVKPSKFNTTSASHLTRNASDTRSLLSCGGIKMVFCLVCGARFDMVSHVKASLHSVRNYMHCCSECEDIVLFRLMHGLSL